MIAKLLYMLSASLPCKLIGRADRPYLERYFLCQLFGWKIYLHRFVNSDGDDATHDHPWPALAICLTGYYWEHRLVDLCTLRGEILRMRKIRALSLNLLRCRDAHRIIAVYPETWTLFICGKNRKGWGFYQVHRNPDVDPDKDTEAAFSVLYHQYYPLTNGYKWWLDAPKGATAGREPFNP